MAVQRLQSLLNQYKDAQILGSGSFGYVFRVKAGDGNQYALKLIKSINDEDDREIEQLEKAADCEYVVKLHDHWKEDKRVPSHFAVPIGTAVLEKCQFLKVLKLEICEGNLEDWLVTRNAMVERRLLEFECSVHICVHIAKGLCYLHNLNIIHRDIKPTNILYAWRGNEWLFKIGDLGLSRLSETSMTPGAGTPLYRAPEVITSRYTKTADIYSFGLVVIEVLEPLSSDQKSKLFQNIKSEASCSLFADSKDDLQHMMWRTGLLSQMLNEDPMKRIKSHELMNKLNYLYGIRGPARYELDQNLMFPSARRDVNILILGETEVGKSAFINGFANYLTFNTLEDALKAPKLLWLTENGLTTTEQGTNMLVSAEVASLVNEVLSVGQSATKESKVYCFEADRNVTIRIIDTPRIGHTRDVDQDNIKNILDTISNFEYLHAIVILLIPNDDRISVMVKSCFAKLLARLHKSAVNNIVFGFTNARGTFHAAGEMIPAVKALLPSNPHVKIAMDTETIYCFDSESFRYLAAIKQRIKFDEGMQKAFAKSWNYSVKETHRLFEHILKAKPHRIDDTTTLNSARQLIIGLTKPLSDLTRLIVENLNVLQHMIVELSRTKHGAELNDVKDQLIRLLEEYQEEHKIVEKAAAEFGCFLKHNAILPYSDARIEYLDFLLKEEKAKAQVSGDDSIVNLMEETKRMYLKEFRIIDMSTGDGTTLQVLEPQHVAKVEARLLQLKHSGQILKTVRMMH